MTNAQRECDGSCGGHIENLGTGSICLFSTEDWDNEPTQSDISPMPLLTPPGNFPLANALLSWHDMGMDPTEWLQFWDKGRQAESIPSIFE